MAFVEAGQAELIRSAQKDDQYLFKLHGQLTDVSQKFLGIERWLKWRQKLDLLADFIYFTSTTLFGFQTLGEEYVNIIQVDETLKKIPSLSRRLISVLLLSSSPYLLRFSLSRLQKMLNSSNLIIPDEQRQLLKNLLSQVTYILPFLQRCHSVLFYFTGAFYHISKRISGIRYILLRKWLSDQTFQKAYKLLGVLSAVQLVGTMCLELYTMSIKSSQGSSSIDISKEGTSEEIPGSQKCSLCLGRRKDATATPCGHLFCWSCITEWLENKEQCPLCREKFNITRLVCLQNFI